MPIAPVLQRFVDEELALAPALADRIVTGTLQTLREARKDSLPDPADRAQALPVAGALQAHATAYRQAFAVSLAASVRASLAEHDQNRAATLANAANLALMDDKQVEINIEISHAMQLIDTTAEWELRELQTFTSTLVGQVHVSAGSNPFSPGAYAAALWEAACAACTAPAQRTVLLRASAAVAARLLKLAWASACSRLEAQGIEPGTYRTVLLSPGSTPERGAASDAGQPGGLPAVLASMPAATPGVGQDGAAPGQQFEQALARLDELLRQLPPSGIAPRDKREAVIRQLNMQRAALVAQINRSSDRQGAELIWRVFDAIWFDPQLPAGLATLLVRLQTSALRVALSDPDMLASSAHPTWQLLDRIAESASAFPVASDPRGRALLSACFSLVETLSRATQPDAKLYRAAKTRLDQFLERQLEAQVKAAAPAVEQLRHSERRELLVQQLSRKLAEQVGPMQITGSMRCFVTGNWAQVLAESMLRDGEQAESTRGYIKLVDELLWSLRLPDHPKSRQRLVGLLPGLLQRLRSGMSLIHLTPTEQSAVLDELMAIHTEALRPGSRGDDEPTLSAEQIVQRIREEVLPPVTGQGGFSDSVIDLPSLDTVPAELMPETPVESGPRMDALRVGDRLRLVLHGRQTRVQVLWRSEHGLFVLFAGENDGQTHSVSLRALERLAAAGLVQASESSPLVQRSLDAVSRALTSPG